MAKRTSDPRPVTLDIDGFPGASVYRTAPGEYWPCYLGQIVGGQMYRSADEAEPAAIAAWVQAHPETWAAPAEEAAELDELTVYCEACGQPVDPAVAVLDGEQMVCPGCAPCSAAEFERMRQAEADAIAELAPDPETWRAISEIPCAPIEPVTPVGETLARGPIFDALCQAADAARDYWRDVPTRVKVYNDAWDWLLAQDYYCFDPAGNLLYPSESEEGTIHRVGISCTCTAGRWGNHCRHAAAADIIGRARRLARMKFAA